MTSLQSDLVSQPQLSSNNINLVELNETVTRIASHAGVEVVQILNPAGNILVESTNASSAGPSTPRAVQSSSNSENKDGSNMTRATTATAVSAKKLLSVAQSYVQSLDADDEISFVQIQSTHGRELMIAPHSGFALVVLKRS